MTLKSVLFLIQYCITTRLPSISTLNEFYKFLPVRVMKVNTVAFIMIVYSVRTFSILSHVK
jgi:hypothetical protein